MFQWGTPTSVTRCRKSYAHCQRTNMTRTPNSWNNHSIYDQMMIEWQMHASMVHAKKSYRFRESLWHQWHWYTEYEFRKFARMNAPDVNIDEIWAESLGIHSKWLAWLLRLKDVPIYLQTSPKIWILKLRVFSTKDFRQKKKVLENTNELDKWNLRIFSILELLLNFL